MAWEKTTIKLENGDESVAQAPIIVSASRSTDIPAFYCDWFFHRLQIGYSAWTNPFNGVKSFISYEKTRFIVFWSKNPKPLLDYLPILKERGIHCYVQFTLNDYVQEGLEKKVPPVRNRIDTFKRLVDALGRGSVIWRYDPLLLTKDITKEILLERISAIGDSLKDYTEKLVFSFADIEEYRKVKSNLIKNSIAYINWTPNAMIDFARDLVQLNKKWNFELGTCAEAIDLENLGIKHNHCIDDGLMIRLAPEDKILLDFLGAKHIQADLDLFGNSTLPQNAIRIQPNDYIVKSKNNKDKGQRKMCGCAVSKDIGQYDTCPHRCEYCYANSSKEAAIKNWEQHRCNPLADTITGT